MLGISITGIAWNVRTKQAKIAMKNSDKNRLDALSQMGCIACRIAGYGITPPEIHHIRHGVGMGQRNNHSMTIPLCPQHHRGTAGNKVPSVHGSPRAFALAFGTELELLDRVNRMMP